MSLLLGPLRPSDGERHEDLAWPCVEASGKPRETQDFGFGFGTVWGFGNRVWAFRFRLCEGFNDSKGFYGLGIRAQGFRLRKGGCNTGALIIRTGFGGYTIL